MKKILLIAFGAITSILLIITLAFAITNKDNEEIVEPQVEMNDYKVRVRLMDIHMNELASTEYYNVELAQSDHEGNFQKSKELHYGHGVYYLMATFVDIE